MMNYSASEFEIVRFFSYTTTIQYGSVTAEVDMNNFHRYPNICERFDEFYHELADMAGELAEKAGICPAYSIMFRDNKTVYQIRHKQSGKIYFIGRYDARRAIGTGCYLFDGRILDFTTMKLTDYISDVRADARNLWMKYEIK